MKQFNKFAVHRYLILAHPPDCLRLRAPTRQVPALDAGTQSSTKSNTALTLKELKLTCNMSKIK